MVDFSRYSWTYFLVCKHSLWNHYSTILMGKDIPYYLLSGIVAPEMAFHVRSMKDALSSPSHMTHKTLSKST